MRPWEWVPHASARTMARAVSSAARAGTPTASSSCVAASLASPTVRTRISLVCSGARVELREDELAVAQYLGTRKSSVHRPVHNVHQPVTGLGERDLPAEHRRAVQVDVLGHGRCGDRIGGELYHRLDGMTDDVALPRGKDVHYRAGRGHEGYALRCRRGRVHEVQPGPDRRFGRTQGIHDRDGARLGDVALCFLLDRRQATPDVSLSGLGTKEVGAFALDAVEVGLVEHEELLPYVVVDAARRDLTLASRELARLAEQHRAARFHMAVHDLRRRRAGSQTGRRVRL